ncbi:hypothetical protein ACKVMT_10025 [Halobacteriales archaeon Cl-PHB]
MQGATATGGAAVTVTDWQGDTGQSGGQDHGLATTTDVTGQAGLIGWIRASPLTVEEAKMLVDAASVVLLAAVLWMEVTA